MGTDSEYTLYAVWKLIVYNITYVLDGGNNNQNNPSEFTILDLPVTLSNARKTGYTFGGWFANSDFSGSAVTELTKLEAVTLYAMWVEGTEGLTYSLSNSKYTVTGYTGTDTVVVIPSMYSGYPVTSIGERAFVGCSSLTSVTIGSSVSSIGIYAFNNCSSINKVNYTGTIDRWVQIDFSGSDTNPTCYAKDLYINNKLVTEANITTATKINDSAFNNCSSLTSVTIPNSVTSIENFAFSGCSSLTSLTIGEYVTSIGNYTFFNCCNLTSITIPNSVTSIGELAFVGCSSLKSITFEDTSWWYRTQNSNDWQNKTNGTYMYVTNSSTNATYFKSTYCNYWYKI